MMMIMMVMMFVMIIAADVVAVDDGDGAKGQESLDV